MRREEELREIISFYGEKNQKNKAIEELGELKQAVANDLAGHFDRANTVEEIADVLNMVDQLIIVHGLDPFEIEKTRGFKNQRTLKRIETIKSREKAEWKGTEL